ncbi:MAG TPA: hypothetical protein VMN38_08130 [Sphingomicrobium sp.]|nr:hypothetical protein [Sphingomicrobium sp.]
MGDVRQQGQAQRSGRPSPGTPVIVDVFASRDSDGSIQFSHEWRFQGGNSQGGGDIDIPAKKRMEPGTTIHFHLRDDTRMLRFSPQPDDAIWVDRIGCPQQATTDPEITDIRPSPNLLTIHDENRDECDLHYNLRFEPDPDRYCYDPTIKNGGSI